MRILLDPRGKTGRNARLAHRQEYLRSRHAGPAGWNIGFLNRAQRASSRCAAMNGAKGKLAFEVGGASRLTIP